jgi:hypothetical protein
MDLRAARILLLEVPDELLSLGVLASLSKSCRQLQVGYRQQRPGPFELLYQFEVSMHGLHAQALHILVV